MNLKKAFSALLSFFMIVSTCASYAAPLSEQTTVSTELTEFDGTSVKDIMQRIYTANSLYSVLQTHDKMRAEVTCYLSDSTVAYSKIIEVTNKDADTRVRIHHESDLGNAEMEGSLSAGYIACQWDDGSTEVACSYPDEFLPLTQETYLEPYENVTFDNVSMSLQDGALVIAADMHYNDINTAHTMYYYVDPDDFHLLAVSEQFIQGDGGSYNLYSFSYDAEESLDECSVLDDVMYAEDAKNLSVVYVAPEYGFTQVKNYTISESVTPNLDSRGYFNLYTSPELTRDSEVDNIDINGDTTIYAVITSYMLQEEAEQASEAIAQTNVSSPVSTPVPSNSPAVIPTTTPAADTVIPTAVPVTPAPTAVPDSSSTVSVIVTKSPTTENVNEGGTAYFNATAQNATSIVWSLVSPDGSVIFASDAANYFGGLRVYGLGSNTLVLENVPKSMDGWYARCAFINGDSFAYSDNALLTVQAARSAEPSEKAAPVVIDDTVSDDTLSALAEQYSLDAVSNVSNRISSFGWYVDGVSSFSYDSSSKTGRFSVEAYYGSNRHATFYFYAYPVLQYYVPIGFDSTIQASDGTYYPLISKSFYSTTDSASCWACFGDGVVAISSAPEIETIPDEPVYIPEDTPYIPEETPIPSGYTPGQSLGSGYLSSIQNDLLVLHVSWTATAETSDTVRVQLDASIESRSITTSSRPLSMSVGSNEVSFYAPGFEYADNDPHYTYIGSYSFTIGAGDCNPQIMVVWDFGGSYGSQYIPNLYVLGTANISA